MTVSVASSHGSRGEADAGSENMPTVLIVDDDPNHRLFYQDDLSRDGYEVVTAASGSEALKILDAQMPDCVVLDISMPGMDGIDAMSRMLSINHCLPIVLNTAYPSYRDNFRSWSADACVVKSSHPEELREAVRQAIDSRRRDASRH